MGGTTLVEKIRKVVFDGFPYILQKLISSFSAAPIFGGLVSSSSIVLNAPQVITKLLLCQYLMNMCVCVCEVFENFSLIKSICTAQLYMHNIWNDSE